MSYSAKGPTPDEKAYRLRTAGWLHREVIRRDCPLGRMAAAIGVHHNTLHRWMRGKSAPSYVQMQLVKDFFAAWDSERDQQTEDGP